MQANSEVQFNSSEHYKNAILYFNELSKQRKTDKTPMSKEQFTRLQQELLQKLHSNNPNVSNAARLALVNLMHSYAMDSSDVAEFHDYLNYVNQLTEKAFLPDNQRPSLLSFPFINKTTLNAILRKFIPNQPEDEENTKDIIKLMSFPGLEGVGVAMPVCIQTRDVNDWDEIEALADYLQDNLDEFTKDEAIDLVTLHDHGGCGDQDPNKIRHLRGRYIYIGDMTAGINFAQATDFNKLLDVLKPYMTDEKYQQYKSLINKAQEHTIDELTTNVIRLGM